MPLPRLALLLGFFCQSYSDLALPAVFLFIALALRAVLGEGKLDRPTMAALAVVSALLTPCKAAYVLRVDLVFRSSEAVFFKELCFFV